MNFQFRNSPIPKQEKTVKEILAEAERDMRKIADSKEIVEFQRRPLPGGGEKVIPVVVGMKP